MTQVWVDLLYPVPLYTGTISEGECCQSMVLRENKGVIGSCRRKKRDTEDHFNASRRWKRSMNGKKK